MKKVRLRGVKFNVDFRKSDLTNYDEFRKSRSFPGELQANDVYLFVSKSQNQLVWIYSIIPLDQYSNRKSAKHKRILDSRRWRIEGASRWNFHMLSNYANMVNLYLIGIPTLREHFERTKKH